jgi:hypothetical protein
MHRIIYDDCVSKNSKNSGLRSNRREAHLLTLDELTFMFALRLRPSATALGPIPVQRELIVEINISSEVFADAKLHKIFEIAKFASVKNVNRLILFFQFSPIPIIYIRLSLFCCKVTLRPSTVSQNYTYKFKPNPIFIPYLCTRSFKTC